MNYHPAATLFPLMTDEEFAALKEDIEINGLREPLWVYEDKLIDGRNRYRACMELGIKPEFRQWDGKGSLVAFVVSLNLKRRHLSSGQKAVIALEVERQLAVEARERLATSAPGVYGGQPLTEIIPGAVRGEARQQAATLTGTNPHYVSDAKRIERDAPEVLERVRNGSLTIPEAKQLSRLTEPQRAGALSVLDAGGPGGVKSAIKQTLVEERDRAAASSHNGGNAAAIITTHGPKAGEFWRLGRHTLYCGDTSEGAFVERAPVAAFAFADPPYNAGVADWDSGFKWGHDWLIERAGVVAVTPGIVSIFEFARVTQMPYLWSVACWIDNGMTRGAMGFGNWLYAALFSRSPLHRGIQDHFRVSIKTSETGETEHKGRKPAEFVAWLMQHYSQTGEVVIDPFLGSGTTLLVAESMGRTCYGGELNPAYCAAIIARWEQVTGLQAEREE